VLDGGGAGGTLSQHDPVDGPTLCGALARYDSVQSAKTLG